MKIKRDVTANDALTACRTLKRYLELQYSNGYENIIEILAELESTLELDVITEINEKYSEKIKK